MASSQKTSSLTSKFREKNPFEVGGSSSLWSLQMLLRIGVLASCLCFAAKNIQFGEVDPLVNLLLRDDSIQERDLLVVSKIIGWIMLGLGIVTVVRPIHIVISTIFLYGVFHLLCLHVIGQDEPKFLPIAIQAPMLGVVVGLFAMDFWPPRIRPGLTQTLIVIALLRICVVVSLAGFTYLIFNGDNQADLLSEKFQRVSGEVLKRDLSVENAQAMMALSALFTALVARPFVAGITWVDGLISSVWCTALVFSPAVTDGYVAYPIVLQNFPLLISALTVTTFMILCVRPQDPQYLFEVETP